MARISSFVAPSSKAESQLDASTGADGSVLMRLMGQRSTGQAQKNTSFKSPSRPTVLQGTIEADNKKRPAMQKRQASKYQPPSPEPPDPNSEAKSATIRRMQNNLEEWERQLKEISEKKTKNDELYQSSLQNRDQEIKQLSQRLASETRLRKKTEKERDQLSGNLHGTVSELQEHQQQLEELGAELAHYQSAYHELDTQHSTLEEELGGTSEQLEKSEGMRRRLNDQVTELQGQLAIEEQRSRLCTLL